MKKLDKIDRKNVDIDKLKKSIKEKQQAKDNNNTVTK